MPQEISQLERQEEVARVRRGREANPKAGSINIKLIASSIALAVGLPSAAAVAYYSSEAKDVREEAKNAQAQVARLILENDRLRNDSNIKQIHVQETLKSLGAEHIELVTCDDTLKQVTQERDQCLQISEQTRNDLNQCNRKLILCETYE